MWFFSFVSTGSLFPSISPSWLLFSEFYSLFFIVLFLDVVSPLPLQSPPLCGQILTRWSLDILVAHPLPLFVHNCVARTYFLENVLTLVNLSMPACFLTRFCPVTSTLSVEEFDLSAICKNCISLKMKSQVSPCTLVSGPHGATSSDCVLSTGQKGLQGLTNQAN